MDLPTIAVPVEALALADVCGESRGKLDMRQVRFGWDAEGPWAAATDAKVFALLRWARPGDDDPRPAAPFDYGVRPEPLARAAAIRRERLSDWLTVARVWPGGVALHRNPSDACRVEFAGETPEKWISPALVAACTAPIREEREPAPPPFLGPAILTQVATLAAAVCGEEADDLDGTQGARVRLRHVRHGSMPCLALEVGEHPAGLLNRGLRLWVLAMGMDTSFRAWEPRGGVREPAPEPLPVETAQLPAGWKWAGEPNRVRLAEPVAAPAGA